MLKQLREEGASSLIEKEKEEREKEELRQKKKEEREREKLLSSLPYRPLLTQMKYKNKEEQKNAYHELLSEAKVKSDERYEDYIKILSYDTRFQSIKSNKEKKQLFDEYVIKLKKKEKTELNNKKKMLREEVYKELERLFNEKKFTLKSSFSYLFIFFSIMR